jgi:hypothetical protein
MKKLTTLAMLTVALGLTGCADTPATGSSAQTSVSSNNAYAYPAVSTTSGSGNAYNWLQGGD